MSDDPLLGLLPGARFSLRLAARGALNLMDEFSEEQLASTGWTGREIDALIDLAQARIEGVPYGDWPPEDEEAVWAPAPTSPARRISKRACSKPQAERPTDG